MATYTGDSLDKIQKQDLIPTVLSSPNHIGVGNCVRRTTDTVIVTFTK